MSALAGGVFAGDVDDEHSDLRQLVDDLGRKAFDARLGAQKLPQEFDETLWADLESTGLARLTSTADLEAGPAESAIVLRGLARHAAAAPIAETDLLAAWLAQRAGVDVPDTGPLTVAITEVEVADDRIRGVGRRVPWADASAAVVVAARGEDAHYVTVLTDPSATADHNLAGEPRDSVEIDVPLGECVGVDPAVHTELIRRGAWARTMQIIGALDAAALASVAHTRERVQFGRPLSKFQAVQHTLAAMAGEIERARASASLAVAAASDYGFDHPATDYAVMVAKITAGAAAKRVSRSAHQLHGAIGTTIEHPLWLATQRAVSWADEFGTANHYARALGRTVLDAASGAQPWDTIVGAALSGPA